MYLKTFLILVVLILKKVTTSIIEKDFILTISIIDKIKISIFEKKSLKYICKKSSHCENSVKKIRYCLLLID